MSDIPIIINNRNRLTTTKKLADDLSKLGYTNIHILDNSSTYPPLLEYYSQCPYTVERLNSNLGQLAIYNSNYINKFHGWVAYSDSDIELNPDSPRGFVEEMIKIAEKYNKVKVGLALRIDDLPDNYHTKRFKQWEHPHWTKEVEKDVYEAFVDTTFSIIKVGQPFQYQAFRMAGNLTARHMPWYTQFDNLSDEEKYFLDNSLPLSTYKRLYEEWKKNNGNL
jgi:hypothetical protein